MRRIDADKLLRDIEKYHVSDGKFQHWVQIQQTIEQERKTGWWLIREGISDAQCSECKMYFRDVYDMDNSDAFCRHCGAKMEGLKAVEDE